MIRNAQSVEQALVNVSFGKKAQNGFDISLKEVKCLVGAGIIHKDKTDVPTYKTVSCNPEGYYDLQKGVYSITFNEGGSIPQNSCGWIKTRSSLIRSGCIIESGLYDTGFSCEDFGAVLFVFNPIIIEQNARVAQFLLFDAEEAELYEGQFQKHKDKK